MRTTLLWLCAGLLLAGTASAQVRYQCRTPSGAMYLSDRPCAGVPSAGGSGGRTNEGMVWYGPSESSPQQPTYIPRLGEAPPHLQYMSARCAGLHDAIRTGPARGLKSDTLSTMQRDYQRECGEDEARARNEYYSEQREKSQQKQADKKQQVQAQTQAKMRDQQCEEGKRILFLKKQRKDLSEGEQADLRRFEENYRARCG